VFGLLCPDKLAEITEIFFQHMFVEENNRTEGLYAVR
jgi:hypothetical protein